MKSPFQHSTADTALSDSAARAVAAVGLGAIALIHIVDLPDTITSSTLVGAEYLALVVASVLTAAALLTRPRAAVWGAVLALAASALAAYSFSRTTGIPGDGADIGNWRCPLGIAALAVEGMTAAVAGGVLASVVVWQGFPARSHERSARMSATLVDPRSEPGFEAAP